MRLYARARNVETMAESTPENWAWVDAWLGETLVGADDALEAALKAQRRAGMPDIEVAPLAGKLLSLFVRMSGAERVLEIGTLGGYSTIWLARGAGEEGRVVTIEAEPTHATIARTNIDSAGVGNRVEILVGRGADVLPTLEGSAPFDFVFIDADKESNTVYLDWAAKLGHPGTVVIIDNVVRDGEVANEQSESTQVRGVQAGLRMLAADPRFEASALQTVGVKGWDGVAIAIVTDGAAG